MKTATSRFVAIGMVLVCALRVSAGGRAEREIPSGAGGGEGIVSYLSGVVLLDGKAVEIGSSVPPGSTLETQAASFCEIRFGERNIFQVRENTLAVLSLSGATKEVELKAGAFAAVFDKLKTVSGEARAGFRLKTPTAVGGVRGTVFFFQIESPESTYVCICNGRMDLADPSAGNAVTAKAERHKALRFIRAPGGITRESAPLLYHTDADMDALAEKVQVRIPWGTGYGR